MNKILLVAGLTVFAIGNAPALRADEILKDKCSAEVAIVATYDSRPDSGGTVLLKRGSNGTTAWTPAFKVKLSDGGHIRWWCRSTIGNSIDAGTWRIEDVYVGTKCDLSSSGSAPACRPDVSVKLGSSAWDGWTPERSRCGDKSANIRARLDKDRRLTIQCMGK